MTVLKTVPRPRFTASDTRCLQFSNYLDGCTIDHKGDNCAAYDLAALCVAIRRAAAGGERECNATNYSADSLRRKVEGLARETFGWSTQWPGFYPSFTNASGAARQCPPL